MLRIVDGEIDDDNTAVRRQGFGAAPHHRRRAVGGLLVEDVGKKDEVETGTVVGDEIIPWQELNTISKLGAGEIGCGQLGHLRDIEHGGLQPGTPLTQGFGEVAPAATHVENTIDPFEVENGGGPPRHLRPHGAHGGAEAANLLRSAFSGSPALASQPRFEVGAPTLVHGVRVLEEGQEVVVTRDEMGPEGGYHSVVIALRFDDPERAQGPNHLAGGQGIEPKLGGHVVRCRVVLCEQTQDASAAGHRDDAVAGEGPQQPLEAVEVEIWWRHRYLRVVDVVRRYHPENKSAQIPYNYRVPVGESRRYHHIRGEFDASSC